MKAKKEAGRINDAAPATDNDSSKKAVRQRRTVCFGKKLRRYLSNLGFESYAANKIRKQKTSSDILVAFTPKQEEKARRLYQDITEGNADQLIELMPIPSLSLVEAIQGITKEIERNEVIKTALRKTTVPQHWKTELPHGFLLRDDGIYHERLKDKGDVILERISGRVWIQALTRDASKRWGFVLVWEDYDGKLQRRAFPKSLLHDQKAAFTADLAGLGLEIIDDAKLIKYLKSFKPSRRIDAVSKVGWVNNNDLIYMFPDEVIAGSQHNGHDAFIFQPDEWSPTIAGMTHNGSVEDWTSNVAASCKGHPFLVFGLCIAFSAYLLKFSKLGSGFVHFYGVTTKGKTSLLQVVASVVGCGANPSDAPEHALIRGWDHTSNALKSICAASADSVLLLDEFATCAVKDINNVVYSINSGQDRGRQNKDATLKISKTWRIHGVSTGEISLREKIGEQQGKYSALSSVKGGQLVRFLEIDVGAGVVQCGDEEENAIFIDALLEKCNTFYGSAGRAFVRQLIARYGTQKELTSMLNSLMNRYTKRVLSDLEGISGPHRRVAKRFGLIYAAGMLAAEFSLLPFDRKEIDQSIRHAFKIWMDGARHISNDHQGIICIKRFIEKNRDSRFKHIYGHESGQKVLNIAGYYDKNEDLYIFSTSGFEEAVGGNNVKATVRLLKELKFLKINERDRDTYRSRVGGTLQRRIAIKGKSILSFDESSY